MLTRYQHTGFSCGAFEAENLFEAATVNRTIENGYCEGIFQNSTQYYDQTKRSAFEASASVQTDQGQHFHYLM